jgi:hypothetical protein
VEAVAAALKPLLQRAAAVSRWRRAALVAGCVFFPLFASIGGFFGMRMVANLEKTSPGLFELSTLLQIREHAHHSSPEYQRGWPDDRLFQLYIADHYRHLITNQAWSGPFTLALIKGEPRKFAEQSVAGHPVLTEAEIEEADAAVGKHVPKGGPFTGGKLPDWFWLAMFAGSMVFYVAAPALIAALLFRGGLVLLIAGVTFVRGDGERASRLRVFWRSVVTWSPLALAGLLFALLHIVAGPLMAGLAAGAFLVAVVALSLALPRRGVADRLAGTWPVPR